MFTDDRLGYLIIDQST